MPGDLSQDVYAARRDQSNGFPGRAPLRRCLPWKEESENSSQASPHDLPTLRAHYVQIVLFAFLVMAQEGVRETRWMTLGSGAEAVFSAQLLTARGWPLGGEQLRRGGHAESTRSGSAQTPA